MDLGTLPVEQYIALFLPFCTSTLSFCCEDLTYFFESLFFFDILRNGDCLQNCAFNDPLFSTADNATQLAASLPKVGYCTIECVSKQEGYIDLHGNINYDSVIKMIKAEFQPDRKTIERCRSEKIKSTTFLGQTYNDRAMKFFFCFWKERQLKCPKKQQRDPTVCENLQYVLVTGDKPEVNDLINCLNTSEVSIHELLMQYFL